MKNSKYKLLYVNGDSFSAGAELAYAEFFPDDPSVAETFPKIALSTNQIDKNKVYYEKINKFLSLLTVDEHNNLLNLEKKKAFPSIVEKLTDIKAINNSRHGASLARIYQSTVLSLTNILNSHKKEEIFVVITLTSIQRILLPSVSDPIDIIINSLNPHITQNEKIIHDHYARYVSDDFLALTAKAYIDALTHFLESHNLKYIFLDSCFYKFSIERIKNIEEMEIPVCKNVIIDWFDDSDKIFLPGKHFTQLVHEKIADFIIQKMVEDFKI